MRICQKNSNATNARTRIRLQFDDESHNERRARKFFKLEGKKVVKSYGVVVLSRTSYIAHPCGTKNSARKKNKIWCICHEEEIIPNCSQATMDQPLLLKERWMDLGVNQEFLERERERESADYLLPPLLPQFTDSGKNQWNLELGFLVRCAMQESLYCDGEFLFSARSAHAKLGTHSKTRGSLATWQVRGRMEPPKQLTNK